MNADEESYQEYVEAWYEKREYASAKMGWMNSLTSNEFLNFILSRENGELLNQVVDDGKFPAYDIALRVKENGWNLTKKQRHAITNVYLWNAYEWKQEWLTKK